MYREKLIKSLGTPEAKQFVAEILAPAILLSYVNEDECWRVIEAREADISDFEFDNLDELLSEFDGEILARDEKFCLLTSSTDEKKKDMLRKYWEQTTTLEELNRDKNTLTKFTYQLLSLEKLIPSLLEPFPVEILLNILIDSLGEIFTSCAAAYTELKDGMLKKVGNVGCYIFPEEMKTFERCYAGSVFQEVPYLIASISEEDTRHFLLFKRDTDFQEEEVSILKMLISLLQKSRYLLNEQSRQGEVETLVNQFGFALQILKNFSVTILSSFEEGQLHKNICDSIKEMFQAEYVSIYEKLDNTQRYKLLHYVDLKKREFEQTLIFSIDGATHAITSPLPFFNQKHYVVKTDSNREIVIFIGESVLENYYKKEIISTLDKIIPAEINRAFSNVDAVNTVKEQSNYIENIAQNMLYISENLQEIEKVSNKEMLLEKMNDLAEFSINTRFKDITLYKKANTCESRVINVGDPDAPFGSVVLQHDQNRTMKDDYMLSFLSQIALQTNEKLNVFKPGETITDFKSVVTDFLKVKYRLAGYDGIPSIYQLDGNIADSDLLDGCGVGVRVGPSLFFASYLSATDINRLFEA